ncbi:C39 family peptidase [Bacillaceae bacterium Marseille-Q3522]|nr:C39 family peptidase [Bacillaceae bacterium Marseille-Q3522]
MGAYRKRKPIIFAVVTGMLFLLFGFSIYRFAMDETHKVEGTKEVDKEIVIEDEPKVSTLKTVENTPEVVQNPLTVPFIQQKPELPRGCEVTSLAMLLNFFGVEVSKMELAEKIDKVPFEENGFRGDMNEGFVGDMYTFDNPGLGVYAKPIAKLANQYLPGRIVDLTWMQAEDLYAMIDKGSPVWVITNTQFKRLPESEFQIFHTRNGDMKVTYWEHSVVITGYDQNFVYINDPLADTANIRVDRTSFEEAWIQMGNQAISIH